MFSTKAQNGSPLQAFVFDEAEINGKTLSTVNTNRSEYDKLTVDQLRKLLKRRSLKQQGNKPELIKRLLDNDLESETSNSKSAMISPKSAKTRGRNRSRSNSRSRLPMSTAADESFEATNGNGESPNVTQRTALPNGSVEAELVFDTTNGKGGRNRTRASPRQRTLSDQLRAAKQREDEMEEKLEAVSIWRSPLRSLLYFTREIGYYILRLISRMRDWRTLVTWRNAVVCLILVSICAIVQVFGLRERLEWYMYWCLLGILSSVGLGTGLHTFLLYLGPFIARVTIAAFECNSIDFPQPPFPYEIVCPNVTSQDANTVSSTAGHVSLWMLMSKVRWESIFWGAGTALGELPPYFVSRSARLAGNASEAAFEEEIILLETRVRQGTGSPFERAKYFVYNVIRRVGFWGILVFASIPNPLFDLAGITCGHFLIPFGTFFGATLIGKSVIKMHLQQMFVIIAFSEHHLDLVLDLTARIPLIGRHIREPIARYLSDQRAKFHGKVIPEETWFQTALTWFVYAIVAFFILSIISSLAKNNYRRQLEALDDSDEADAVDKKKHDSERVPASAPLPSTQSNNSRPRSKRNRLET